MLMDWMYGIKIAVLFAILVSVVITDIKRKEIETEPILFGLGFVSLMIFGKLYDLTAWDACLGFLLGGGVFVILAFFGMGGGDIKLMAMIGAFLGWYKVLLTMQLAFIIGALFAAFALVVLKRKRKDAIAFGPAIALATVIISIWGDEIISRFFTVTLIG